MDFSRRERVRLAGLSHSRGQGFDSPQLHIKTSSVSAGDVPPPAKASRAAPATGTIAIAPTAASATAPTAGSPEIDSLFRE